jgi:hypothetical protein
MIGPKEYGIDGFFSIFKYLGSKIDEEINAVLDASYPENI